jgi:MoaA/NifB/PqqE/SkfB family radical SAM enzyme
MKMDDARRYIDEAAAIPNFSKVTFTGGEPLMFQKEHIELLERCRGHGLETRIVTNGFWAEKIESGLRLLARLKEAGLSELNFSADKFHLEFQNPQILKNALECARQLGFPRIVSFVTNSDQPPLDVFAEMYGIPRDQMLDLRLYLEHEDVFEQFNDKIFVYYGGLIGLGRAADYPQELRKIPIEYFPGAGRGCPEVINKPVIYPDGALQACCCAGGKLKTFTVGNLREHTLRELFTRMSARTHWKFINTYGPRDLYDAVASARPDLPRKREYGSICEVCVDAAAGLHGDELDEIANAESIRRMFEALGVTMERDDATLTEPASSSSQT